jgi:hypothetical protein
MYLFWVRRRLFLPRDEGAIPSLRDGQRGVNFFEKMAQDFGTASDSLLKPKSVR